MVYLEAVELCVQAEMESMPDDIKEYFMHVSPFESSYLKDEIVINYKKQLIKKYALIETTSPDQVCNKVIDILIFQIQSRI